jgi:hypothetical protein
MGMRENVLIGGLNTWSIDHVLCTVRRLNLPVSFSVSNFVSENLSRNGEPYTLKFFINLMELQILRFFFIF